MSIDAELRKVEAGYAIEYLLEHPEAGLCCEDRRCWITPNANETDRQALLLDAAEAERLKDDPRLRRGSSRASPMRAGPSGWFAG